MTKTKEDCNFDPAHYGQILKIAKKLGYKFCFFSEAPDKKYKKMYLRHDVEFSMEGALRFAKMENKNGAVSTFFVRFNAPFYNLFDPNCLKIINEIIGLGHQVGLHFEESGAGLKELTEKNIEEKAVLQLKFLKNHFDIKNIVSFHCPSRFVQNREFNRKKFINTYSPDFFSYTKYLSESRGEWFEGCVCEFLKSHNPPQNLQVLTHSEWWGKEGKSVNERLTHTFKEKIDYLDKSFATDSRVYKPGSILKFFKK